MKKRREKVRDKYWSEDLPNNDIDFIEVPLPDQDEHEQHDDPDREDSLTATQRAINKKSHLMEVPNDPEAEARLQKKKQRLVRKVFKAASEVLTDIQLKIFTMRAVYNMSEDSIAKALPCDQSYVSIVWKASVKKIRKALRIKGLPLDIESDIIKETE